MKRNKERRTSAFRLRDRVYLSFMIAIYLFGVAFLSVFGSTPDGGEPGGAWFFAFAVAFAILWVGYANLWREHREYGDTLLLMRRAVPLPLHMVGLHTPVWTRGRLTTPEPIPESRTTEVPCVYVEEDIQSEEYTWTHKKAAETYLSVKGFRRLIDLESATIQGLRQGSFLHRGFRFLPVGETVTVCGMLARTKFEPKAPSRPVEPQATAEKEEDAEEGVDEEEIAALFARLESPRTHKRNERVETRMARRKQRKTRKKPPRTGTAESASSSSSSSPNAPEPPAARRVVRRILKDYRGTMIVSTQSRHDTIQAYERHMRRLTCLIAFLGVFFVMFVLNLANVILGIFPRHSFATIGAWLIIGVSVVASIVLVSWFNRFAQSRLLVGHAWGGIEVEAKRRAELVPRLVEVVRGSFAHEKRLLAEVTSLRDEIKQAFELAWDNSSENAHADKTRQHLAAEEWCRDALGRLLVRVEELPELKSHKQLHLLFVELQATERRIEWARAYYNQATTNYNTLIERFPAAIVARITGFTRLPLWQESSSTRIVVERASAAVPESNLEASGSEGEVASEAEVTTHSPQADTQDQPSKLYASHAPLPRRAWYVAAALVVAVAAANVALIVALV